MAFIRLLKDAIIASLIKRGNFWYIKMYDHLGKQVMRKGYSDKRETQALATRLEDEGLPILSGAANY